MTTTERALPVAKDQALLSPYRVLDLADEKGMLCGKIFGDMGADVVKVEPPGGDPSRRLPPFYEDVADPERSLVWWALNTNKRSVTLNLETEDGRAIFHRLIQTADFLVESFRPGYLADLGLGYSDLQSLNPRLVFVSITPYGQTGPHSQWAAADLNVQGMATHMYLTGDVDRSPVRISVPTAFWHSGAEGAAAAMIAHRYRQRTGRGQHVDVSMQQCILWTLLNTTMTWQLAGRQEMRGGATRQERGNPFYTRMVWACQDGFLLFIPIGGGGGKGRQKSYLTLVDWMREEGIEDPLLTARDWNGLDMFSITQDEYDTISAYIERYFQTKTVAELYERAVREKVLIAPIATMKDLLESPQLRGRDYFVEVYHPELQRSLEYAGPFARFSRTPLGPWRRAPRIGEHTQEVLGGELGYSAAQLSTLRARNAI